MAFVARGGLWLSSSSNAAVRTDGVLQAIASGEMRLTSLAGAVHLDAGGVADVLRVSPGGVAVRADLLASNLGVADHDGAGLVVLPAGSTSVPESLGADERSLRWRAATASQPSGWDVRAGGAACVRLTRPATSGSGDLAYGLRVNPRDELELYRLSGGAQAAMRVVACFGGPRDSSSRLSLPVSRNPWVA
jgi:hypothetical protein